MFYPFVQFNQNQLNLLDFFFFLQKNVVRLLAPIGCTSIELGETKGVNIYVITYFFTYIYLTVSHYVVEVSFHLTLKDFFVTFFSLLKKIPILLTVIVL